MHVTVHKMDIKKKLFFATDFYPACNENNFVMIKFMRFKWLQLYKKKKDFVIEALAFNIIKVTFKKIIINFIGIYRWTYYYKTLNIL